MNIQQRIAQAILHFEKNNKTAFAQKTGIPNATLSSIIKEGGSDPKFETLAKIVQAYPTLRMDWLMKGEGEIEEGKPNQPASLPEQVKQMVHSELDRFKADFAKDIAELKNSFHINKDKPD